MFKLVNCLSDYETRSNVIAVCNFCPLSQPWSKSKDPRIGRSPIGEHLQLEEIQATKTTSTVSSCYNDSYMYLFSMRFHTVMPPSAT